MPLPFILGAAAAVAGVVGVGSALSGAAEMSDAKDTMKSAEKRHQENIKKFERNKEYTCKAMDSLGEMELKILHGFERFSDTFEKIKNRPEFKEYKKENISLPKLENVELKNVSTGAGVLLSGLGGAVLGTAGGFASTGATTAAVMALGTASTGIPIAALNGVASINATLAALGGGSLAAGGGGMLLGSSILGGMTLGVGLLVGGIIFNATGSKLSDQADEAWKQMQRAENEINNICSYLRDLKTVAINYTLSLTEVRDKYSEVFGYVSYIINKTHKTDWNNFSDKEKLATENCVLLVQLLYKMCQVNLVNQSKSENGINTINQSAINQVIQDSEYVLEDIRNQSM